jgi:hypothetical protein
MQIEVVIQSWEHDCCGTPFRVGAQATWHLQAAAPESGPPTRFVSDAHDQLPADVPHWDVTGTVAAITGISYPYIPVPGQPGTHTADTAAPTVQELHFVDRPSDSDCGEFRVVLDLPDGTPLPSYVLGAERSRQLDDEARTAHLNRERMTDPVGTLLEALADEAQHRYAHLARSIRGTDRSALTLQPHRTDAAAIGWSRSGDADTDGITVQVGDGHWNLSASPADAAIVRVFLDAAVTGSIEEHVRPAEAPDLLETEVLAADGRSWTASTEFRPFRAAGVVAMPKQLWHRVQRGEHRYAPWAPSP